MDDVMAMSHILNENNREDDNNDAERSGISREKT